VSGSISPAGHDFDCAKRTPLERCKLLCAIVVPRPIALVTSVNAEGRVNAAPFSLFNAFSEAPAQIVLSLQHKPDGTLKDTTRNHARADMPDAEKLQVDPQMYRPVGRRFGTLYCRQGEVFALERPSYPDWLA
jgi:hypothetical protein